MAPKPQSPRALDVATLAREGGTIQGHWPAAELQRLLQGTLALEAWLPPAEVAWAATGELRAQPGGNPQVWLHLQASCQAALTCQRCLQPLHQALEVQRDFLFVATEAQAAALDEELEDDVLVMERALDLQALIEDELILALPLVPRHGDCQIPLPAAKPQAMDEAEHPFAALARLRRPA